MLSMIISPPFGAGACCTPLLRLYLAALLRHPATSCNRAFPDATRSESRKNAEPPLDLHVVRRAYASLCGHEPRGGAEYATPEEGAHALLIRCRDHDLFL